MDGLDGWIGWMDWMDGWMDYKKRKKHPPGIGPPKMIKWKKHNMLSLTQHRIVLVALSYFDFLNLKDGRLVVFEAE